jgi:hypothetical protein
MDKEGHVLPISNGNVSESFDVTESVTNVTENVTVKGNDVTEGTTDVTINVTEG